MSNKYIKVSTYAKEVNMTRAGVYAKIKRGELPFKKIDGVTFVKVCR